MGWSELRVIPNHYNEEAKVIDTQILELVQRRRELAGGIHTVPGSEQMQDFAQRFGLQMEDVAMILGNLNDRVRPIYRYEEGKLLAVLPIMKKSLHNHCEYVLTHAMQYESYSLVMVEIQYLKEELQEVQLQPNLTLAVIGEGEYTVQRYGSRGGGPHAQLQFLVSPKLPDELQGIEFSLIPEAMFLERRFIEINLNQQVDF